MNSGRKLADILILKSLKDKGLVRPTPKQILSPTLVKKGSLTMPLRLIILEIGMFILTTAKC